MIIQSLSIVVPNKKCINDCGFCVSKMTPENYINQKEENIRFFDLYQRDYISRLEFARDNGCNTVMLTGNSEPQQNRRFLQEFGTMIQLMKNPFKWIEMQTTGVLLDDEYLRFLRNHVKVSTISVSISSINNKVNAEYNGMKEGLEVDLGQLCSEIKRYDFNLRLSINLTDSIEDTLTNPAFMFDLIDTVYGADQITFRKLYTSGNDSPQDEWIKEHGCSDCFIDHIRDYIKTNGTMLEVMPFGSVKYSVNGMGVVLDDDCMSKTLQNGYKYLILRPNCKLYSQWDDKGSLIF